MIFLLIGSLFAVVVLGILLILATPQRWPMTPGSVTAKKIFVDGQAFVVIEGEPMNYLGQVQSINVEFDHSGKELMVTRCIIRWNPFSKIVVNNQWPVFYPLAGVKPGKYPVIYNSSEGDQTAGSFDLP